MKLAYLVNQYPKVSHTFIRREIAAIEDLGVTVERFSIRPTLEHLDDAADQLERERTRVVLAAGVLGLARAVLWTCLVRPWHFVRAARLALSTGRRSESGLLRHLIYLGEACALTRWMQAAGCTHLHAHFGTNPATVAMLSHELGGPPFSFTVHGPEEFDKPDLIGLSVKIQRSSFVAAVSSFGLSQLYRRAPFASWPKLHVVRCGVDDSFVQSPNTAVPQAPRLVCVGRLCEQKGQLLLVEAAAKLAAEGLSFELVLVGDGEMRSAVEAAVARHGLSASIRITGWASGARVRSEIVAARALVLPSFAEGLPVVLMEALALGRPVISTYIAGIPELVETGQSGWLVPAGSVDALADAMREALTAPVTDLAEMGAWGRRRVRELHDVRVCAAALCAVRGCGHRMIAVVDLLLLAGSLLLALPALVFFIECAAALIPGANAPSAAPATNSALRVAVLIPAHDEAASITATVSALLPELGEGDFLLVVADNCTDTTATLARAAGARVIERSDAERRGKGYALEYGIAHLAEDPPDVVEVIDADCRTRPGSVRRLAEFAVAHGRPAQADNVLTLPENASPLAAVSVLAFLVRNRVRPTGMRRLGLPCHLMGTGMAFPWEVLRKAPPTGSHLVEDMLMGIELAALGYPGIYCSDAGVTSLPPTHREAARGQRRRWEHGHLATLLEHGPKLVWRGITQRKLDLFAMGLDLLVPPMALLVMLLLVDVVLAAAWFAATSFVPPLVIACTSLGLVVVSVLLSWAKFGRQTIALRHLFLVPFYMLWKVPVYLSFLVRGRHTSWDRAERNVDKSSSPP